MIQKYSQLFGKTMKTVPKDATLISHKLLYQGGFIRESAAGRYFMLPLGWRVQQKIQEIIKTEMDATGAQEMITPTLHPKELWKETNRTTSVGFELMSITDRNKMEFVLGGTAEEMMVDVVRKFRLSYKDLPFNIYQFSTKFRDEMRARGGLLRVREFMMKDAYSFDADEASFKKQYKIMEDTYTKIFNTLNLPTVIVESDNGYIGGEYCHEFVVESDAGETKFLTTQNGSYAAHEEVAVFKHEIKNIDEPEKVMRQVDAIRGNSMEDGVALHNLPLWQQMKDVMMVDERGRMISGVIRGDYEVNEIKLAHAVNAYTLRHATEDEIHALGSEAGFITPVGLKELAQKNNIELVIVGDPSLRTVKNMYTGANIKHLDLLDVNIDRDYTCDIEYDIALAKEGYMSLDGQELIAKKGVEVGNIFQLGHHYTTKMKDATYTDKDGKQQPYYMGSYGLGLPRTLATIVEIHHDDRGIIWPANVAPYDIYFIALTKDQGKIDETLHILKEKGYDILLDDRDDIRPGEKFADADLLGIPVRIVLSDRTIKDGKIEVKRREETESSMIAIDEIVSFMEKNTK